MKPTADIAVGIVYRLNDRYCLFQRTMLVNNSADPVDFSDGLGPLGRSLSDSRQDHLTRRIQRSFVARLETKNALTSSESP